MITVVSLSDSFVFMGYRKRASDLDGLILQLTKVLSTNKFSAHIQCGGWGQLFLKELFWIS